MTQTEKLEGVIELLSLQQAQLDNIDKQLELLTRRCSENANSINMIEGDIEEIKARL